MPGNRRWTAAERIALRIALKEGATYAEAGHDIGRTDRACRSESRRRGLTSHFSGRPPDLCKRCLFLSLVEMGMGVVAIARRLNVHTSTATRMAQALVRDGLLRREGGPRKSGRYRLTERS